MMASVTSRLPIFPAALLLVCALVLPAAGQDAERNFDSSITVPELFEKARDAFGLEKYELAETFYQEILIRETANVQAMLELSNVYERGGKLEYARGLLIRSAKIEPDNTTIRNKRASVEKMLKIVLAEEVDSLFAGEQYELAVPKLSLHLSLQPDDPDLLYKKALCYTKLGRPEAALTDLDRAIRIDQKERYYALRSEIVAAVKQKEAQDLVAEARKLIASESPGGREQAVQVLAELLQLDPENEWARAELAGLNGGPVGPEGETAGIDPQKPRGGGAGTVVRAVQNVWVFVKGHLTAVVLMLIVLVVFRSPLASAISKRFFPRPVLSGTFPRFSLSEILLMLNAEHHTGVLSVRGDACRGKVYFENGEPCHSSVDKLDGTEALEHLLDNTASGYFDFSDGSMPRRRTIDMPLSIILIEHNRVPAPDPGPKQKTKDGPPGDGAAQSQNKRKSRMKELLDSTMPE